MVVDSIGHIQPLQGLRLRSREHRLPSGQRIDLLCEAQDRGGKGDLVAVELKRGKAGGPAVGQLLQYMSELRTLPSARERLVRGVLLARTFDPKIGDVIRDEPVVCCRYRMGFDVVAERSSI